MKLLIELSQKSSQLGGLYIKGPFFFILKIRYINTSSLMIKLIRLSSKEIVSFENRNNCLQ